MPLFTWGTLHEIGVVLSGWELNNLIKLNITLGSHFLNLENRLIAAEDEMQLLKQSNAQALTPEEQKRLEELKRTINNIDSEKKRCVPELNLISRLIETKKNQEQYWENLNLKKESQFNPGAGG
ncbi:hypothetical protein Lqui_0488 [Legionella quinlivanii]|uniref:Coiled-coil protein n=1 Tax=Legionella quinlivanii TaxID=45073 RepID=A0A0W0Y3R4_9GAMM|nr:hypothetical protein [Legionella quinlivanii]KTD51644.1 hypothetical protein Lqui_0488 [Legionella quinlivanii]SEF61718.1 hypothetical protein SAMN02746093_00626 [Legionella quinlivanii DSM 21216]STY10829.1 Uncharacterised protein [Legionella quinlivanii]